MYRQRRASLEKVNGVETVREIPAVDVALSEHVWSCANSGLRRRRTAIQSGADRPNSRLYAPRRHWLVISATLRTRIAR